MGSGIIQADGRLTLSNCTDRRYSNAQLYNYGGLRRRDYPSRPPLRMTVRVSFSHRAEDLKGTAGFGFWNQPMMPGSWSIRAPRYAWFFFGSPPHDMPFARGVPGRGWKAATADFSRLAFWLMAPGAPLGFLLMRSPELYRALWPAAQWAIAAAESLITADIRDSHEYRLDWSARRLLFSLDGQTILETNHAPRGPLGFVAWMDNQYAIITPQGRFQFGLLAIPGEQWMNVESLHIEPG